MDPADPPQQTTPRFDYDVAFSRNIGWLTRPEQQALRDKRIAIAGLGGVGGRHLLTLTRLGIQHFTIADLDVFDVANFNRQLGADMDSVGRAKIDVMSELALAVNPDLDLRRFSDGVTEENLDAFLDGANLYVDGLDFFVIEMRERVFAACAARGIPAITAAPLGMGTAFLAFMPGGMTFEDYFQTAGRPTREKLIRFLVGLSPAMLQMTYLVDPTSADFDAHKGPSTPMGCDLSAGVLGSMAMKILLGRGKVPSAPWGLHFDAYRNRMTRTWRPGGMRHPLMQLVLRIARSRLAAPDSRTR
jgi:molybdopterin/thiamine biosynthesis adenylyltransferase